MAPTSPATPDQAPAPASDGPAEGPTSRLQAIIDKANDPSVPLAIGNETPKQGTAEASSVLPMDQTAATPTEQVPASTVSTPTEDQPSTGSQFRDWLRDANSGEVPVAFAKARGLSDAALDGAGVTAAPEIIAHRGGETAQVPAQIR